MKATNRKARILSFLCIVGLSSLLALCSGTDGFLVERQEHGFRAIFPGPAAERSEKLETAAGTGTVHRFIHIRYEEQYEVSVNEMPATISVAAGLRETGLDRAREHLRKAYRGRIEKERTVKSAGVEGVQLDVRTRAGGLIKTRIYERDNRLYIASARVRNVAEAQERAHQFVESVSLLRTR